MAKQLMIYENLVLLNSETHRDWYVKTDRNFGFANDVTWVPLTAVEFRAAAMEYPIVFADSSDNQIVPVAVMGLKEKENLYIGEDGELDAKYVPAFLRRYPFVFSMSDDRQTLSLCIDESFHGINQEGRGERLFDADGERTQFLNNVLNFQQEYDAHFKQTSLFCAKLAELDLLEPMTATLGKSAGEKFSLTGFKGITREKLMQLTGDELEQFFKTGQLELAYCHLFSLGNFGQMMDRMDDSDDGHDSENDSN